jgi:hypothetical protein
VGRLSTVPFYPIRAICRSGLGLASRPTPTPSLALAYCYAHSLALTLHQLILSNQVSGRLPFSFSLLFPISSFPTASVGSSPYLTYFNSPFRLFS